MAYNAENILVGAADLYIAKLGTLSPIVDPDGEGEQTAEVPDGVRVSTVLNPAPPAIQSTTHTRDLGVIWV